MINTFVNKEADKVSQFLIDNHLDFTVEFEPSTNTAKYEFRFMHEFTHVERFCAGNIINYNFPKNGLEVVIYDNSSGSV